MSENTTGNESLYKILTITLLLLIMAGGAFLRFTGIDWDEGHLLHPDERFFSWVTSSLVEPESLTAYFDTATSTFNPNNVGHGFYVYGTLPAFLGYYAGLLAEKTSLFEVFIPGRILSASFDIMTILMVFLIARKLLDRRAGLAAAALYAGAALPIQLSHFYAVDTFTAFFAAASLFFALRTYEDDRLGDPLMFGLMLGLGMACKVSIAPLAITLMIALYLRIFRERTLPGAGRAARRFASTRAMLGLFLAGIIAILVFRVAQPYAFMPPDSASVESDALLSPVWALQSKIFDPIGFAVNPAWLDQMQEVRYQVSGYSDIPPNHQWAHRLPILFPLRNLIAQGLGWPLGVFALLALAWALFEVIRARRDSGRLALPAAWILFLLLWQGSGWVTSMRYFLSIYGALAALAGWALITLADRTNALLANRKTSGFAWPRLISTGLLVFILLSGIGWGVAVSRIFTGQHTRIAASEWIVDNVPSDVTLSLQTTSGLDTIQLGLVNNAMPPIVPEGQVETHPAVAASEIAPGVGGTLSFTPTQDSALAEISFTHLLDPTANSSGRTLTLSLTASVAGNPLLYQGVAAGVWLDPSDPRGPSVVHTLPEALPLTAGVPYTLTLLPDEAGPLQLASSTIATEGPWDDPVPQNVRGLNIWNGQYQGLELNMFWDDFDYKVERLQSVLDQADILTISSNRFYDSLPRNPDRFPLSVAYYRALFDGSLGFELVADFTNPPRLGPLVFNDEDSEEAWTVYDHPRVMVFAKTVAYSPENTAAILGAVNLDSVIRLGAKESGGTPVILERPALASQLVIGSDFTPNDDPAPDDFWTRFQPVTAIVFYALITLLGLIALPLAYRLFSALPDRGASIARIFGLLLAAYLSWLIASVGVARWTPALIAGVIIGLALISLALIWRERATFLAWIRENRASLIRSEVLAAIFYVLFLLIRWGNPDLWHPYFGGEKPMDLSYFNAVLRSDVFPPYDPWFAGDTLKYYYFGFVMVGLPVKLLGIPSALAYNLIIPLLASLTGGAAYGIAFNLLATAAPRTRAAGVTLWNRIRYGYETAAGVAAAVMTVILGNLGQVRVLLWALAALGSGQTSWKDEAFPPFRDVTAGFMALREGGVLPVSMGNWYWDATRIIPVPVIENYPTEVGPITEFPFFTFLYADLHAHMINLILALFALVWAVSLIRLVAAEGRGERQTTFFHRLMLTFAGALITGAIRPTNTWDWPVYILVGAVTLLFAAGLRRGGQNALRGLLGGLMGAGLAVVAVFLFTTLQGGFSGQLSLLPMGLAAAAGFLLGWIIASLADKANDRKLPVAALAEGLLHVALLVGIGHLLFLPYHLNTALQFNSLLPWSGSHTPLWTALFINGLFYFILFSWMIAEMIRVWRATYDQAKRRQAIFLAVFTVLVITTAVLLGRLLPVLAVIIPLASLAILLFFRLAEAEKQFVLLLILLASVFIVMVEMVIIEGDIGRMNTVFKFSLQVWLILAACSGAALGWLLRDFRVARDWVRTTWLLALLTLVLLAFLYPVTAARAKIDDRWVSEAPRTLDGMAYMPYATRGEAGQYFSLQGDYAAIRWLQENVEGNPVILETHPVEYNWGSRFTVYTGLPGVVGWANHQRQQRPPQAEEVNMRAALVNEVYLTLSPERALEIIALYDVDLVIVGELERAYASPEAIIKFNQLVSQGALEIIYDRYNTIIYRVVK